MAWQEPRYIYTKPDSDPVSSAISGVMDGLKMYMGISAVQGASSKNALNSDVSKAYKDMESSMPTAPAQPNQAAQGFQSPKSYTPEQLTAMQGAQSQQGQALNPLSEASQGFGTAPQVANSPVPAMNVAQADEAAQAKYQQEMADYQNKVIEKRAEFSGKLIDLHRKHGFVKEAADLENNYIKQVNAVAELDPDMAAKVWNNGWAGKQYGNLKVSKAEKWEALPDGSGVYNKSNPNEIHKFPSSIEEFTAGGQTFVKDNKGGIHQVKLDKPAKKSMTKVDENTVATMDQESGEVRFFGKPGGGTSKPMTAKEQTNADREARLRDKDRNDAIQKRRAEVDKTYDSMQKNLEQIVKNNPDSDEGQKAAGLLRKLSLYRQGDKRDVTSGIEPRNFKIAADFLEGKYDNKKTEEPAKKDNKTRKPLSSFGR